MGVRQARRWIRVMAVGAALGSVVTGGFSAAAAQAPEGPYAVGVTVLEQRDESRTYHPEQDPWDGDIQVNGDRPIQTLIWYPAQSDNDANQVLFEDYMYLSGSEETFSAPDRRVRARVRAFVADYVGVDRTVLSEHLGAEMRARWDAPVQGGRFPLIVYAPGWTQPSWMNYELGEMLASHGYVVAASPSFSNESRDMVDDFPGLDAQARDITFLVETMRRRGDVLPEQVGIVGYSWGAASNIIAAQRLEGVDAVVSIDGYINIGYTAIRRETADIAVETMKAAFMSLTPPPYRTDQEILEHGMDTSFVFYEKMEAVDAYDLTFTRMRDHEDVVSVYTRFLDDQGDRTPEDREASKRSYGLMNHYILRFLNAYVADDEESLEWLRRAPEQNGLPRGYLDMRWKPAR